MNTRKCLLPVLAGAMLMLFASASRAAVTAVGPTDPVSGYPATYTADPAPGITLGFCLGAPGLPFASDPNCPIVTGFTPDQVGFEGFYWILRPNFGAATNTKIVYTATLEGATLVVGQKQTFIRRILKLVGQPAGTYHVDDPFGSWNCIWAGGQNDCKLDIGVAPNVFTGVLGAHPGLPDTFLSWSPITSAPAGYLGNFNVPHVITVGPGGRANLTVTPPVGVDLGGGAGVAVATADFFLGGKIQGPQAPLIYSNVPADNLVMNRISGTVTKVIKYFDANGDPMASAITGTALPAFCAADNTSVANQTTITCTPTISTPQTTTAGVTFSVTDTPAVTVPPTAPQTTTHTFSVIVNDLAPTINPVTTIGIRFDNTAVTTIPVTATDPDGNVVTLSATPPAKSWLSFNPASGIVIAGPVPAGDLGNYTVTVHATDDGGATAVPLDVQFSIVGTNVFAPVIQPFPAINKFSNDSAVTRVPIHASDGDNNIITLQVTVPPTVSHWLSYDNVTKEIVLDGTKIAATDVGSYTVTVNAVDSGVPPLSAAPQSATVTILAAQATPASGGGGGGGCALSAPGSGWNDVAGAFFALALLGPIVLSRRFKGRRPE